MRERQKLGGGPRTLREALQGAVWEELVPELLTHGEVLLRIVGWREGDAYRPSALEVRELVNEAVVRSFAGVRGWDESNPPALLPFLKRVMRSIASATKKHQARFDMPGDVEPLSEASSPEEELAARSITDPRLVRLDEATAGDDDLQSFVLAAFERHTERADMAEFLGWAPEKVSVVRRKLLRRLLQLTKGSPT